jgi:hypothetical protein
MDNGDSTKSDATSASLGGAQDTVMRVEFRPPALWRVVQWAAVVMMIAFTAWIIYVASLGIMELASNASRVSVWALTLVFFGIPFMCAGAIFGLMRLTQPFGILEIHENGLFLACYTLGPLNLSGSGEWFPWGIAEWRNLAPAGVFRLTGARCMGLRLLDLELFLTSRQEVTREDLVRRTRLGPQWARIAMNSIVISPIGKFMEMIWVARGVTAPKSLEEKDVLTWNQENYGFHIIVPSRDIPGGAQALVDMIEKARKAAIGAAQRPVQEHKSRGKVLSDPEARLVEITDLLNKGLITNEEYSRKRDEILSSI